MEPPLLMIDTPVDVQSDHHQSRMHGSNAIYAMNLSRLGTGGPTYGVATYPTFAIGFG